MKNKLCELIEVYSALKVLKNLFSSEFGISLDHGVLLQEIAECSSTISSLGVKYSMTRNVMNRIVGDLESMELIKEDTERINKYVKYTRYFIVTQKGEELLNTIYESGVIPNFVFNRSEK